MLARCQSRLWAAMTLWLLAQAGQAAEWHAGEPGVPLPKIIRQAAPGDTVVLAAGVYHGNLVIDKPLTLRGEQGAVLDGGGTGDVVRLRAANIVLQGLTIRHSGLNLTQMNAGVFVEKQASGVLIENNDFEGNAFGIWLDASPSPRIIGNRIHGTPDIRSQDRGNGIHLFNITGAEVANNEIWETRDGIYIDTSNDNVLRDNHIHHLRYGIHYMYSHHNRVSGNRTHDTRTGYALMQSHHLTVTGNRSENDTNYGILMNYITYSTITDNTVTGVRKGRGFVSGGDPVTGAEGKAVFIYNAQFNQISGNRFSDSDIGIHLTAGSEDNALFGNSFIANQIQVKYVANRPQEWSRARQGNYWSDYIGWDLNADGIGDRPYEPNDGVDRLLWKYPLAKILMHSPAITSLRWVQAQFPVLRPQGVMDSSPLMRPPPCLPGICNEAHS